jgi:chaperone modulatory protein CbpM
MENNHMSDAPDPIDESTQYNLDQFCALCRIQPGLVIELVEQGVIQAEGRSPGQWIFTFRAAIRLKRAYRLQRDLDLNLPGVALTVDLLEEIDLLRQQVDELTNRLRIFL